MPRVTAVIPTFGRPDLVSRAVASVLVQTMRDLEVVVVIDGDDPATVARLAAIDDARLRWFSHPEKRGAGRARDTGADLATGDWVAFLDDDDEWLPEKLACQLASAPGAPAVIMALSRVVSSYGTFIRPNEPYDGSIPVDEWLFDRRTWMTGGESFLQTSSLMMPRELFKTVRFTDTRQHEEWELVIRAVKRHGYRLITPGEPLVIYYVPEKRKSLSRTYTWRQSILWAQGLDGLLSPRAFSGFCLTVIAQMAAANSERGAFLPILRAAFRDGAPTAKQLFAFALFWLCPTPFRYWIRARLQGQRGGAEQAAAA